MSVTTCLMPRPRWHDGLLVLPARAAVFAAWPAAPVAAIEVPARPRVPSSAAELAAAVTRKQAAWRPARPRASRPLLMSSSSHAYRAARQAGASRARTRCHALVTLRRGFAVSSCLNLAKLWPRPCLNLQTGWVGYRWGSGQGGDLAGQGEVVRGEAAGRVGAEGQRHLVPVDSDVGVVVGRLGQVGDGSEVEQGVAEVGTLGDRDNGVAVAGPRGDRGKLLADLGLGKQAHAYGIPFALDILPRFRQRIPARFHAEGVRAEVRGSPAPAARSVPAQSRRAPPRC